jgi:hypothetical protein
MSGLEVGATASAPDTRTVAPAVLEQHTPAVRYIDPKQSNVIMESGTKSPSVSLTPSLLPGMHARADHLFWLFCCSFFPALPISESGGKSFVSHA